MQALVEICKTQSIRDVFLICEIVSNEGESVVKWSKAESGPLAIEFDHDTIIFSQPIGRDVIDCAQTTLSKAVAELKTSQLENDIAAVSLLDLFCYRRDTNDVPPRIQQITGYQKSGSRSEWTGLLLKLSTGGIIGIDASSYGGLTFFLDGQLNSFRSELVGPMMLDEQVIWQAS